MRLRAKFSVILVCILVVIGGAARAESIVVGGTGSALGVMRLLGEAYARENPGDRVEVLPSLGSGGGIRAAAKDALAIAVSARPLAADELAMGLEEHFLARTPLGFVVNGSPMETNVTSAQLIDIYAGRVRSWPDGTPIRLVLRPDSETDYRLIAAAVEGLGPVYDEARNLVGMPIAYTDSENAELLVGLPGAFGTMTLSQRLSEGRRQLTPLALNGVMPDVDSLENGSYPLWKDYRLIVGKDPGAAAERFLAFVQTSEARDILLRTGHLVDHGL